jgi:hypothetical protein
MSASLRREILSPAQAGCLAVAQAVLAPRDAVLAGGLSLALRYGHRRSHDMDWFIPAHRDLGDLAEELARLPHLTLTTTEPGTLHGTWDDVPFSIIRYRYPLRAESFGGLPLADLRTIAGMKLLAALNRGARRDLIDLATCLDHGADLATMISQATADIPGLAAESLLRSLAYHDDAEREPDPDGLAPDGWTRAQATLAGAIRDFLGGKQP